MNVPTVDVSAARLIQGIPWVETDDEAITRLALDHLRDCGLQNFAFFGDPFYNWSIWRQQNFERISGASRHHPIEDLQSSGPQGAAGPVVDTARSDPGVAGEPAEARGRLRLLRCVRSAAAGDLPVLRLQGSRGHRRHRRRQRRTPLRARDAQHVERHSQFLQGRRLRGRDSRSHDERGKASRAQVFHRTSGRPQARLDRRPVGRRSSHRQSDRLHPAERPRRTSGSRMFWTSFPFLVASSRRGSGARSIARRTRRSCASGQTP